jgi:hypothetical protein
MSTAQGKQAIATALSAIPEPFRTRLVKSYTRLKEAFIESSYDTCGIRAGVFAETLLRLLQHQLTANFVPFGQKITNFNNECLALEQTPKTSGSDSLRIVIPRALNVIYTIRNKRGIGHAGGDVDANEIDASAYVRLADWCISELIRIFHSVSLEEAQEIVDAIAVRQLPVVWTVVGKKRVLDPAMDFKSQTLLLLYSERATAVPSEDLYEWTEYSRYSDFKTKVLIPLHQTRYVEYDRGTETVIISLKGASRVEKELLPSLKAMLVKN